MSSLVYSKLGGGIHGIQPKGGLAGGTLEGGNSRSMSRFILRNTFEFNKNENNVKFVQDSSNFTTKKRLNSINNLYNAIKF